MSTHIDVETLRPGDSVRVTKHNGNHEVGEICEVVKVHSHSTTGKPLVAVKDENDMRGFWNYSTHKVELAGNSIFREAT